MYLQILGRREYRCIQLYIQPVQEILIHVFQLSLNLDTFVTKTNLMKKFMN